MKCRLGVLSARRRWHICRLIFGNGSAFNLYQRRGVNRRCLTNKVQLYSTCGKTALLVRCLLCHLWPIDICWQENTLNLCYKRYPKFFPRTVSKFFQNFPRPCLLFCLLFFCEYSYPVSYPFQIFRSAIAFFKSKWKSSLIFNSPLFYFSTISKMWERRGKRARDSNEKFKFLLSPTFSVS